MDLLERYLQAVRFFLPRRQQDDIVRELSENLISQMEDREEELGRPLTDEERADILRRHGHPMIVAGRYRAHQQLIGPTFFPIYVFAIKLGVFVAVIVTIVAATVTGILDSNPLDRVVDAFVAFPRRVLTVFAWTTLGFAALDLAQSRLKLSHRWDPRQLPKVVRHEYRLSRLQSLCELLLTVAYIVWLLLVPGMPFLVLGPAASFAEFAPIWSVVYAPIVFLAVATVVLSLVNVLRPYWTPARSIARIAIHGASFVVFAVLLRSGAWVGPKADAALPNGAPADRVIEIINSSVGIILAFACIMSLVEIARELYRARARRKTLATESTAAHITH